jgi:hypothetical protein
MGVRTKHLPADPDRPYVEIKRVDRFSYVATLHDPGRTAYPALKYMTRVCGGDFLTRRGAQRWGARILRRYMRTLDYASEGKTIITLEEN